MLCPPMPTTSHPRRLPTRRQVWLTKIAIFLAISVFIGWFYGWAHAHFFPENTRVGFPHGIVHGALMPMALPSLVMGKDVKIYDDNNTGRSYKLGYICGINVCGLLFFGSLFWKPKRYADPVTRSSSERSR